MVPGGAQQVCLLPATTSSSTTPAPSYLVDRTKSINVSLWNRAMKAVGVPEAKWTEIRGKLMRVLLDEHDNILRSYQAQKRGDGSG